MMSDNRDDLVVIMETLKAQNELLRTRLEEAEEALRAISTGEVDALVVYGEDAERIYTLQGADYAYRVMVESIHEGAANIAADGTILYCNKHLAVMVDKPLELVLGSSFLQYLHPEEIDDFAALAQRGLESFDREEFRLLSHRGSITPVLITASVTEVDGRRGICLVVTDLTDQKQALAREKELQIRLMEQREEERVRIARNLHDGPLQDVIGLSYTVQAMAPSKDAVVEAGELQSLRESILKLAGDLRSVCNDLRPPNIIRFGLAKAIRYQSEDLHAKSPNLTFHLDLMEDGQSIPKNISTTLFRIFQESTNNVIRHANASEVIVRLALSENTVRLEVKDNGSGFTMPDEWIALAREGHLGLVGMRERVEAAGGKICITTAPNAGTAISVEVPCQFLQQ